MNNKSAIPALHVAMGDSKGGDRGSPPFGASKSVAFAQHRNKEAIPAFFSGNGCNKLQALVFFHIQGKLARKIRGVAGTIMTDMSHDHDIDNVETKEWLQALASLIKHEGTGRAAFILQKLLQEAEKRGVSACAPTSATPYCNTIPVSAQPDYPGDLALEAALESLIRWNAIAMVLEAKKVAGGLGGHLSSFASIATLYEVGMNHFFRGRTNAFLGDLVYFQGHSAEGNYARAFLEGRLTKQQLRHFRQEVDGKGVSSYPHPWLMPDFWQFATVSLGLGLLQGVYQAQFLKYLTNRKLLPENDRKVWVFCGDGEMDEAEAIGGLTLAAREKYDNLIFVINCNLQRLDGLVRSNGKVIQELEALFTGDGWRVIKVLWSSEWDRLF